MANDYLKPTIKLWHFINVFNVQRSFLNFDIAHEELSFNFEKNCVENNDNVSCPVYWADILVVLCRIWYYTSRQ